jgi:hypothetical protein
MQPYILVYLEAGNPLAFTTEHKRHIYSKKGTEK